MAANKSDGSKIDFTSTIYCLTQNYQTLFLSLEQTNGKKVAVKQNFHISNDCADIDELLR